MKASSITTIDGNEPYFFEHNGHLANETGAKSEIDPTSVGIYYIAIHSYDQITYSIKVDTVNHDAYQELGTNSTKFFDID